MSNESIKFEVGKNAHGHPVYATHAISPAGNRVQVAPDFKLKEGWRFAPSPVAHAEAPVAHTEKTLAPKPHAAPSK